MHAYTVYLVLAQVRNDVFLQKNSMEQVQEFLVFINRFAFEVGGKSIDILNVSITLHRGKHEFEIFKKLFLK